MKNQLLLVAMGVFLGTTTLWGQRNPKSINDTVPPPSADTNYVGGNSIGMSSTKWNAKNISSKTKQCEDVLDYAETKHTLLGNSIPYMNHGSLFCFQVDNEKLSSAFINTGTISIKGVQVTCANLTNEGSPATGINVKVSVYNVDEAYKPTTLIGSATSTDLVTYEFSNNVPWPIPTEVTFDTPLEVTGNYAVVVETTTPNGVLLVYTDRHNRADGSDWQPAYTRELFAKFYTDLNNMVDYGNWNDISVNWWADPLYSVTALQAELMIAPVVSYSITADATAPAEGTKDVEVTFTNTSNVSVLNRMTSFRMFKRHFKDLLTGDYPQDSIYMWNPTGTTEAVWADNLAYTYPEVKHYHPKLTVFGGFSQECEDVKEFEIDIEEATLPNCEIEGDAKRTLCIDSTIVLVGKPEGASWGLDAHDTEVADFALGSVKGLKVGKTIIKYLSETVCEGTAEVEIEVVECNKDGEPEKPSSGINESDVFASVTIAPNPTNNVISIVGLPEQSIITISDLNGKVLHVQNSIRTQEELSLGDFVNGIYLLTIQSKDVNGTRKIVLNK